MKSPNKKPPTSVEKKHIERVAALPCVVCGESGPSEVHEPQQGAWWASIALCPQCHRGSDGWHGTRKRWTLRRMDEIKAINETVRGVYGA